MSVFLVRSDGEVYEKGKRTHVECSMRLIECIPGRVSNFIGEYIRKRPMQT